ncbi:FHA domain-containing protein [Ktedonosporobacter rubrisoli]|uniref:FHA domain-containing protein n=1 Tax=Ktedonosporobacter rubrisoli TaxID=2509675 RepID=A0A4P6JVL6_KTERU|nr:FHA domain-containing protein [Ktedonosporobacter rubrisoli]QBD79413.1 FHA domain-containing protein [Ktedonosporobacter rubrisoli]
MSGVNHPLCVIQILSGQLKGKTFPVHKPVVTLGRDSNNDIVIFDPKVSRHHARLLWENGNWSIEKVAQRNTLTVNRRSMVRSVLQNGDTIGLGEDTACLFLLAEADAQAQVTPQRVGPDQRVGSGPVTPPIMQPSGPISSVPMPAVVSPTPPPPLNRPIAEKTAIGGMPALIVSSNVGADKQTHPLLKPMISIGRHQSNDIVIGEPVISNIHAQIVREGDQWVFVHPHPARDKTLNGLIYQGNFIPGNQQFRKPLVRGDIFRIGDMHGTLVTLAYDDGSGALQEPAPDIHPIALDRPLITLGRAPITWWS